MLVFVFRSNPCKLRKKTIKKTNSETMITHKKAKICQQNLKSMKTNITQR